MELGRGIWAMGLVSGQRMETFAQKAARQYTAQIRKYMFIGIAIVHCHCEIEFVSM